MDITQTRTVLMNSASQSALFNEAEQWTCSRNKSKITVKEDEKQEQGEYRKGGGAN